MSAPVTAAVSKLPLAPTAGRGLHIASEYQPLKGRKNSRINFSALWASNVLWFVPGLRPGLGSYAPLALIYSTLFRPRLQRQKEILEYPYFYGQCLSLNAADRAKFEGNGLDRLI